MQATELEFLEWFYTECDFGPAHDDVIQIMQDSFEEDTGKEVPDSYSLKKLYEEEV